MPNSEDYEYSGRYSKFPPLLRLLGYFGFGLGCFWLAFDRLKQFSQLEELAGSGALQPMMRVHWLEKWLYELGGKYAVFGFTIAFGFGLLIVGISRLRDWLRLRNSQ